MKYGIKFLNTAITKRFNLKLPIIQAPMAGGVVTPKFVATVSEQGGLGSLPLGYLTAEQAMASIQETKKLTTKPFSVNAFVPQQKVDPKNDDKVNTMQKKLTNYYQSLGLNPKIDYPKLIETSIEELIEITITENIPAFSFTFGPLLPINIQRLKENNIFVIGTATTVREGLLLEQLGCDAVIGQGYEAGGHRGTFLGSPNSSQIGTIALVRQLSTTLKIPVIAAGGIMDGQGLVAALALGAAAVQMGTAFLTCQESGANSLYREAILNSTEESTVITPYFTGKLARGIKNCFVEEMEETLPTDEIPSYPLQHCLTQELRREASKQNIKDFPSFWAGQGTRLSHSNITIKELLEKIEKEAKETIKSL
jgi:nitronate monooxygenase